MKISGALDLIYKNQKSNKINWLTSFAKWDIDEAEDLREIENFEEDESFGNDEDPEKLKK